ncbi:LysR family transcriptional regulator [Acetobacter sp.]|jgi:DNA-binding transcriptional LysR family regulator|uniref:LysR family transcriptional regulator n=1 Tax=Acetobacter sp. TaxID=440 RepID=UPI0025BED90D|nr:LysR family transcriptional regulator [Acetobacter sp.]MCH4091134.1 LysR family transcriptional regulator [Acetobacter sp.]MCI1301272.1 LysR family transcriptional regulator [Acetobacter sp.]MCI1317546.1 LysR family transcriptional regulator [Acetobacter sp.]
MDQFDLLRLYVDIAEQGSLSAVARIRGLSPSTVTLGLQTLETRVGVSLVRRTTRRLSFTPEGERFLADCRRILVDLEETLENVSDKGRLQGEIRMTVTNDFGRNRLAPLIDGFMKHHPDVIVELMLTDAVQDLVEERYDLAIRMGQLADSQLTARLLMRGQRHVCAAPDYWKKHGYPSHPRDLTRYNCMVLARPGAPQANWSFHEKNREFSIRVSGDRLANDGGTLRDWAVAGAGVVLKSSCDVEGDIAAGRLLTALDEFSMSATNVYAVYPHGRLPNRRVTALIDYLVEHLAPADRNFVDH